MANSLDFSRHVLISEDVRLAPTCVFFGEVISTLSDVEKAQVEWKKKEVIIYVAGDIQKVRTVLQMPFFVIQECSTNISSEDQIVPVGEIPIYIEPIGVRIGFMSQ